MAGSPRAFISYSHDSLEHKQKVRSLADRLRGDGIDVRIDQYVPAPPEGWPRWMEHQIANADFVLLICTEIYHRRVSMNEEAGKGLGALWESNLIYQLLYEAGTVNPKFIPALPSGGKAEYIPAVLRGAQRYEPFTEDGYWSLYRRLTGQPAILMPPVGQIRKLSSGSRSTEEKTFSGQASCTNSQRAGIWIPEDSMQAFIPVIESHWGEREATISLEPDEPEDAAFLDGLRNARKNIWLAYRNNVASAGVHDVRHRTKSGKDQWDITFHLQKTDFSDSMEMNTTGLTADQAAVLRARRLLLNENPAEPKTRNSQRMDTMLQEILIAGQGTSVQINGSPFPQLFLALGRRPDVFVEAAWIFAVLQLKLSNTVEQISRLELTLDDHTLQVQFAGKRHKPRHSRRMDRSYLDRVAH